MGVPHDSRPVLNRPTSPSTGAKHWNFGSYPFQPSALSGPDLLDLLLATAPLRNAFYFLIFSYKISVLSSPPENIFTERGLEKVNAHSGGALNLTKVAVHLLLRIRRDTIPPHGGERAEKIQTPSPPSLSLANVRLCPMTLGD